MHVPRLADPTDHIASDYHPATTYLGTTSLCPRAVPGGRIIGIAPVAGGWMTGGPTPGTGGAMTPLSGTGRAPPPPTCGFSLLGRGATVPSLPGGMVGEAGGRMTSGTAEGAAAGGPAGGTACPQLGTASATPAPTTAHAHHGISARRTRATTRA